MKEDILINLLDEHNEGNLLATDKFRPCKVIYLKYEENSELYEKLKKYHKEIFPSIDIESYIISEGNIKEINNLLNSLDIEKTIINVTGGKRINSLILLNQALIKKFNIVYIDILNKRIYELGNDIKNKSEEFKDIYIDDILKITGSDILLDSSKISKYSDVINITEKIYENLELWYKYKQCLYDNHLFIHDYSQSNKVIINLSDLYGQEEKGILNSCLNYLEKINAIKYKKSKNDIVVHFQQDYMKGFIFKSGTWLEVLTNIVVREIEEIDDVKSGVIFLWNNNEIKVKNEFDVLAVKDDVLICISCKDSAKYDEDALNELDVYSKRLGGNNAKKILVATQEPYKRCIKERAEMMGISLIILDKDIEKFKNELKKVINK
ncbi:MULTISPECIES: DUF1887 family CARF protein [Clostridium]|uniref:DUF1887 family CARF protein n=1 Tax=Clostridium aquiflavi TaxID=3073603 RepID=A0ABU1EDG8_9CLOT|nr:MULTISPECIES: DUF1887 family CARF protein [unclassified Clostridium]MDR5586422.1 DUF1887 family CARF protein [Clostridium sp. 5N-1]NFG63113.1 DUF1887 family protein [Clostridium botulinum]NFQ10225.1 DUF1887 family protein [Clostridium botulinum]